MNDRIAPGSTAEVAEVVRSFPRLLAVGSCTKSRLSAVEGVKVATSRLAGMVEYQPSEFTFTARSGTPLREVIELIGREGQYLPFDPMMVEAGATLGGTVAAGLSGPGRLRFGGLKDFILGVQFVDGMGRVLRAGGKVVKNAAGFDLPKFFVGSYGRLGILTEVTFKVFPAPQATVTLKLGAKDIQQAVRMLVELARHRCEPHALDILPGACDVFLQLAGPAPALSDLATNILAKYPGVALDTGTAHSIWSDLREFKWTYPGGQLLKVILTPQVVPGLVEGLKLVNGARIHVSCGGSMGFVSLSEAQQAESLHQLLSSLSLSALTLRGGAPLFCGTHRHYQIEKAVKLALDPDNRFPELDH